MTHPNPDPDALQDALAARDEYTTMTVSRLDLRRLRAAKRVTGNDEHSHRQFLMWLIDTHPDVDDGAIEADAVESFVSDVQAQV